MARRPLQSAMTANAPPCTTHAALSKRRVRYAQRRLKQMRLIVPDLPDNALENYSLRHLSFAVRKFRGTPQSVLQSPPSHDLLLSSLQQGTSAGLSGD